METFIGYEVRMRIQLRRDGRDWIAQCPAIDVSTQARTKKEARKALCEATDLWFESCISRNVLHEALLELGFNDDKHPPQEGSEFVKVTTRTKPAVEEIMEVPSFSLADRKNESYLIGEIPAAALAARQLEQAGRVARSMG